MAFCTGIANLVLVEGSEISKIELLFLLRVFNQLLLLTMIDDDSSAHLTSGNSPLWRLFPVDDRVYLPIAYTFWTWEKQVSGLAGQYLLPHSFFDLRKLELDEGV
jgi:hypothetical protein